MKLGWFCDWKKIKEYLQKERDILEMRYYAGVKSGDEKMASFLRYPDNVGITPVTKPIKVIKIADNDPLEKLRKYSEIYKSNCDV